MEKKQYVYTNNCTLNSLFLNKVGDKDVARLVFSYIDKEKQLRSKSVSLWLTSDDHSQNVDKLKACGMTIEPARVDVDFISGDIPGLGNNVVDLVSFEDDDERNARYINTRKFPVKIWANKQEIPF